MTTAPALGRAHTVLADISRHFAPIAAVPLYEARLSGMAPSVIRLTWSAPSYDRGPAAQPPAGSESAGPWKLIKGPTRESATDTSAVITWTTTIGGRAVEAHIPRYPG